MQQQQKQQVLLHRLHGMLIETHPNESFQRRLGVLLWLLLRQFVACEHVLRCRDEQIGVSLLVCELAFCDSQEGKKKGEGMRTGSFCNECTRKN